MNPKNSYADDRFYPTLQQGGVTARNALRGKRALCNTEMEGKITKAEAEARGLVVDTTVYPRVA